MKKNDEYAKGINFPNKKMFSVLTGFAEPGKQTLAGGLIAWFSRHQSQGEGIHG